MADREKLIELIFVGQKIADAMCDKQAECINCQYDAPNGCRTGAVADYLIANGVILDKDESKISSKWIPVTERLPEDICPVLVALEGLNIAFHGWYQDEKWWCVGAPSRPFTQKVTHWMPLPQPPKGE